MEAFWLSTGVVFVAELGDKSQIMTLAFASRFEAWKVVVGITAAAAAIHAVSVLVGSTVAGVLPPDVIDVAAGVVFIGFGVWTALSDPFSGDGERERRHRSPVLAVAATFLLAELGDKTMLATVTLSSTESAVPVWLGATVGMVGANLLAIVVGRQLGRRLPGRILRWAAAGTFAVFGVVLVVAGLAA
jgi:Ca2+/H+ antiporter, TMEM165/GDT1 family